MTKKFICIPAILLAGLMLAAAELPKSIEIESGKVRLRLAAEKVWNINRIEWNGNQLGVDSAGAHYGMAFQPQQSRFYIGSGHRESGIGEELIRLSIEVDGKAVTPENGKKITGKKITVSKESTVSDFVVNYSFTLADDRLDEKITIKAKKLVKVNFLYCFMHPWMTRFTDFLRINADGSTEHHKFVADNKDRPIGKFNAGVWYEPKTGLAVVTVTRLEKGTRNAYRTVWDRPMYRKDYLTAYSRAYFRPENELQASASTSFFCEKDLTKWQKSGIDLAGKLK